MIAQAVIALSDLRQGSASFLRFLTEGTPEAFAEALGAESVIFDDVTADKTVPWRATFADGSQLSAAIGVSEW